MVLRIENGATSISSLLFSIYIELFMGTIWYFAEVQNVIYDTKQVGAGCLDCFYSVLALRLSLNPRFTNIYPVRSAKRKDNSPLERLKDLSQREARWCPRPYL